MKVFSVTYVAPTKTRKGLDQIESPNEAKMQVPERCSLYTHRRDQAEEQAAATEMMDWWN